MSANANTVAAAPSPPPSSFWLAAGEEVTAAVEDERNEDDDDDDEREARSCWHSSLWKAFHAARWQASLQNLRCRQPLQRSSFWLVARVPQCAHLSMVVTVRIGSDRVEPLTTCRVV